MDRGDIDLASLAQRARASRRTARVRALSKTTTPLELLYAQIVVGPRSRPLYTDRRWIYEQCLFAEWSVPTRELARLFDTATSRQPIDLGGVLITAPIRDQPMQWTRKPSRAQWDALRLRWPTIDYDVRLEDASLENPIGGFLIANDGPSFPTFGSAFNAFFHDNYVVSGTQSPSLGSIVLRFIDDRAWIDGVRVRPTELELQVKGRRATAMQLEFNSATDQRVSDVRAAGRFSFPLPRGLPQDAWVWLKASGDWFDYRSIGGWPAYDSSDVVVEVPDDPVAELDQLITQGEGPQVEFKAQLPESRPSRRTTFKTVVAFAHGTGGTVVFGVEDDGTVIGLDGALPALHRQLIDLLRSSVTPTPEFSVEERTVDDKNLLLLRVRSGRGRLHAVVVEPDRPEYYIRRGATTYYARPDEVTNIFTDG